MEREMQQQVVEAPRTHPCGAHSNRYMLVAYIGGRETALFEVHGLERARAAAARLSAYHETHVIDLNTGAIVANAVEVVPVSVEDAR